MTTQDPPAPAQPAPTAEQQAQAQAQADAHRAMQAANAAYLAAQLRQRHNVTPVPVGASINTATATPIGTPSP